MGVLTSVTGHFEDRFRKIFFNVEACRRIPLLGCDEHDLNEHCWICEYSLDAGPRRCPSLGEPLSPDLVKNLSVFNALQPDLSLQNAGVVCAMTLEKGVKLHQNISCLRGDITAKVVCDDALRKNKAMIFDGFGEYR